MMSISEVDDIDQNMEEVNQNENIFENILEESESDLNTEEIELNSDDVYDYPNEAYGDLMSLVTKHKISNVTGNAIIKFLINMQI